jgi:clan AA aspartic protease
MKAKSVTSVGMVRKRVKLMGEKGTLEIDALIDTGTNRLLIPKEVAERLGVKPMFKVKAELADGSVEEVDVGPVFVEMLGRGAPEWAAIVEKGEVCVGAETLETLGLAVDPVTGEVYPTRRFVWRI